MKSKERKENLLVKKKMQIIQFKLSEMRTEHIWNILLKMDIVDSVTVPKLVEVGTIIENFENEKCSGEIIVKITDLWQKYTN